MSSPPVKRSAKPTIAQLATGGLTAAAFEHWDSLAGDPTCNGKWRSLDARALYRITVAASECYNTAFETALTSLLPGVRFTPRPDTAGGKEPVREISHIPFGYIEHFSRRRRELEARYSHLVRAYRARHGRDPDAAACHKLAQQACLDTRPGKKPPQTLAAKRAAWQAELTGEFGRFARHRGSPPLPM